MASNGNENWKYESVDSTPRSPNVKEMPPVTSQSIYDENCAGMGADYPR